MVIQNNQRWTLRSNQENYFPLPVVLTTETRRFDQVKFEDCRRRAGLLAEVVEQNHEVSQAAGGDMCEAIAASAWPWDTFLSLDFISRGQITRGKKNYEGVGTYCSSRNWY